MINSRKSPKSMLLEVTMWALAFLVLASFGSFIQNAVFPFIETQPLAATVLFATGFVVLLFWKF